ncbi:MAG: iron-sulfur cluster assembly scaffold protein [Planctomycetaceae bacterium]
MRECKDPYADWVLPHASSPTYRGEAGAAAAVTTVRNPTCGDEVRLSVVIGRVPQIDLVAAMAPGACGRGYSLGVAVDRLPQVGSPMCASVVGNPPTGNEH